MMTELESGPNAWHGILWSGSYLVDIRVYFDFAFVRLSQKILREIASRNSSSQNVWQFIVNSGINWTGRFGYRVRPV